MHKELRSSLEGILVTVASFPGPSCLPFLLPSLLSSSFSSSFYTWGRFICLCWGNYYLHFSLEEGAIGRNQRKTGFSSSEGTWFSLICSGIWGHLTLSVPSINFPSSHGTWEVNELAETASNQRQNQINWSWRNRSPGCRISFCSVVS